MKKTLILSIMTGYDPCYKYAASSIEKYARTTNSDFKIITKPEINFDFINKFDFSRIAWAQKFLIKKYLSMYDQVLYVDADIIINNNAANIFEFYSDLSLVYMFNEAPFENRTTEFEIMEKLANKPIDKSNYYNAGVILVGKNSNFLTNIDNNEIEYFAKNSKFYEQSYFNFSDKINRIKISELDSRFNRMAIIKPINDRFSADFIHHAGAAYSNKSRFRFYRFIQDYCQLFEYKLGLNDYSYIISNFVLFYFRRKIGKLLK